jgi:hypothetical protein
VLEGIESDKKTREMLGLDDIEEIIDEFSNEEDVVDIEQMEEEAQAVKEGESQADIKDPDEIIEGGPDDIDVDGADGTSS